MTWWADAERNFFFTCSDGHDFAVLAKSSDGPEEHICPGMFDPDDTSKPMSCGLMAKRTGFSEIKMGTSLVVTTFEQNGRLARRYRSGGKSTYISESKLHYLDTGDTGGKYSKAYDEKVVKDTATHERAKNHLIEKYQMGRRLNK